MDKPAEHLGALIYYLDVDKDQWKEQVQSLIPGCTIERNPQITIVYGLDHSLVDLEKLIQIVHGKTLDITLGEIGIFNNDTDIVYIKVQSIDVELLNHTLRHSFPYANQYKEYTPHITLGFANHGASDHLIGYNPGADSLGLTQPIAGSFYYLTPDKKRILL
ncbi:2'-5' RNA ligase family protein [Sphingobacterium sp. Lzh-3]|uniref:2'-5' RNA ligase family protein n=1 Tax=Sphingobacterium sp. Lzh-3 TaxID=3382150 RepID=UPI00398D2371